MSYASGRSNFATSEPDGAFWVYQRDDGSRHVCATNAAGLLAATAAALGVDSGAWTADTLTALRGQVTALADADPSWNDVAARLVGLGSAVSRLDLIVAIYLAYYRPNGLRFDAISLPADVTAPVLGQSPGGTPQPLACFVPGRDVDPASGSQDVSFRADVAERSSYGVRLQPGEAAPRYETTGRTGYVGPSNTALLVGIGIAGAAAIYLWTTSREYKRGSRR